MVQKFYFLKMSENMTRRARMSWGLMSQLMLRIHQRYPATEIVLTPSRMFCDNRFFSVVRNSIVESSQFSVPLTEEFENKIRSQMRCEAVLLLQFILYYTFSRMKSKLNIEDLLVEAELQ